MKTKRTDKSLESYKIFPYIAMGIIFTMTFFVLQITKELKATTDNLAKQSADLQKNSQTPVHQINDFSR